MSQPVPGTRTPDQPQAKYAAVDIGGASRVFAWIATSAALLVGFYLAIRNFNGLGTASVFAVALLFGVVALSGTLPATVKVGDVEVLLQRAKQEGQAEGAVQAAAATMEVAALQKDPAEAAAQLRVPDAAKPAIAEAFQMVHQAATSDPLEWQAGADAAAGRVQAPTA